MSIDDLLLFSNLKRDIEEQFSSEARIVLYPGDVNEFLNTIPQETVKLIVTSPPYNIGKAYETRVEIEKYLERQAEVIVKLYQLLKPNGSICWQVGNYVENSELFPLDIFYYQIFKSLGMKLRNRIIWHFGPGLRASKRFSGRYETLLWFTKGDTYTFNLDNVRVPAKYPANVTTKVPTKTNFRAILKAIIRQTFGRLWLKIGKLPYGTFLTSNPITLKKPPIQPNIQSNLLSDVFWL